MSPAERAARAHALAEAADDPRDKAAYRAAARAWEKIASPGVTWSNEPLRRDLAYARSLQYQDARVSIEREAGKMLLAA